MSNEQRTWLDSNLSMLINAIEYLTPAKIDPVHAAAFEAIARDARECRGILAEQTKGDRT